MPRKPQVTRTMTVTTAKVLCLDLIEEKPFEKVCLLPGSYATEAAMMKRIHPLVDSSVTRAVHVIDSEISTGIYAMSEQEFLLNSRRIENRK